MEIIQPGLINRSQALHDSLLVKALSAVELKEKIINFYPIIRALDVQWLQAWNEKLLSSIGIPVEIVTYTFTQIPLGKSLNLSLVPLTIG